MPNIKNIMSAVDRGLRDSANFAQDSINTVKMINRGVQDIRKFTNQLNRGFDELTAKAEMMQNSVSDMPNILGDLSTSPEVLMGARKSLKNKRDDLQTGLGDWVSIFESAVKGAKKYTSAINQGLAQSDDAQSFISKAAKFGTYEMWLAGSGPDDNWDTNADWPTVGYYDNQDDMWFGHDLVGGSATVAHIVKYKDGVLSQSQIDNPLIVNIKNHSGLAVVSGKENALETGLVGPDFKSVPNSDREGSVYGNSIFWSWYWSNISGRFMDDMTSFNEIKQKISELENSINISQQFSTAIKGGQGPLGELLKPVSDIKNNITGMTTMFSSLFTDPQSVIDDMSGEIDRFLQEGADVSVISFPEEGEEWIGEEDNNPPDAMIHTPVSEISPGESIQFTDASSDMDGDIQMWQWSFGDGSTSSSQNPAHTFSDSGTYDVQLVVTDSNGNTDTDVDTVNVIQGGQPPTADMSISKTTAAVGEDIQFTDLSSDPDDDITSKDWDMGDGRTNQGDQFWSSYSSAGTYTVTLTVTDAQGNSDSISENVEIQKEGGVTADFTYSPSSPTVGSNIDFSNNSQVENFDEDIKTSEWDFGDGSTSTKPSPDHIYMQPGTYSIQLTIESTSGQVDTITKSVDVVEGPSADFSFDKTPPVPVRVPIQFTDESSSMGTSTLKQWHWDFADGSTSTSRNPSHTYYSTGLKGVTLTVTDSNGIANSITKNVEVGEQEIKIAPEEESDGGEMTILPGEVRLP